MAKEYVINGKKVVGWFRRGKARIPRFEDGTIGHNQNKVKNIEELDSTAKWLYDNDVNEWNKFTDDEIKELAKLSQITKENPGGRVYDDEVFDEMDRRGLKLDDKSEIRQKMEKSVENLKNKTLSQRAREIDKINSKNIKNDNEDVISNKQFKQASKIDDKLERAIQMQVADDVGKTLNDDDIRFRAENYIRHNYNGDASTDEIYEKLKSAYKNRGWYEDTSFKPRAVGAKSFEEHGVSFRDYDTNERFSNYLRDKYGTDDIDIITTGTERTAKSLRDDFNQKSYDEYKKNYDYDKNKTPGQKMYSMMNNSKDVEKLINENIKRDKENWEKGISYADYSLDKAIEKKTNGKYKSYDELTNSTSNYKLQYDDKNQRQQMTYKSNAYDDTEYAWARTEDYDVNGEWTIKNPLTKEEEYVKGKENTEKRLNEINSTIQKSKRTTNNEGVSKFSLGKMSTAELRELANQYGLKSNELSRKQLLAQLIAVFNK